MAQGAGCGQKLLGCALLVALFVVGVGTCTHVLVKRHNAPLLEETDFWSAMTPQQRAEELRRQQEEVKRAAEEAKAEELKSSAAEAARKYVLQSLKYPHDASFPWSRGTVTGNPDTGVYWVVSTVKAKNALGAELTHDWKVNLKLEDNTWHLCYLEIDDEPVYMDEGTREAMKSLAEAIANPTASDSRKRESRKSQPPRKSPERPPAEMRTWTDSTDKFSVEAQFVKVAVGVVTLRKADGKEITLPVDRLSQEDRDWIKKRARGR